MDRSARRHSCTGRIDGWRKPDSSMSYLLALARGDSEERAELDRYATAAGVDGDALVDRTTATADVIRWCATATWRRTRTLTRRNGARIPQISRRTRCCATRLRLGAEQMHQHRQPLYRLAAGAGWPPASKTRSRPKRSSPVPHPRVRIRQRRCGRSMPMRVGAGWREAAPAHRFPRGARRRDRSRPGGL